MAEKQVHLGRNVKRIREIMGIKQDALAVDLDISQQGVSLLEQKAEIDDRMLERIAQAMKVPVEAIRNFNEDATVYNIQHNYEGAQVTGSPVHADNFYFNPIDKWIAALEENKTLYERLLQSEREKVEMLQQVLKGK